MSTDQSANNEDTPLALALAQLGVKVALGKRGEYLADFIDDRRAQRVQRRVRMLGEAAELAGLDPADLVEAVGSDDDTQELLEEVLHAARSARYERKIVYLGKCLATAVAGDDAAIDTAFMKVAAVRDLDAVHMRLLSAIKAEQDRWASALPRQAVTAAWRRPVRERSLVQSNDRDQPGIPESSFHAAMSTLVRNGLVVEEQNVSVDVEVDVQLQKARDGSLGDPEADTDTSADAETVYRLSGLGAELLDELEQLSAQSGSEDEGEPPS